MREKYRLMARESRGAPWLLYKAVANTVGIYFGSHAEAELAIRRALHMPQFADYDFKIEAIS